MLKMLKKITEKNPTNYVGSNDGDDFEYWIFPTCKDKKFKTYNIVKTYLEDESKIEWYIEYDEYSSMGEEFSNLDENEIDEWIEENKRYFEKDEEIIKFLEDNEGEIYFEENLK